MPAQGEVLLPSFFQRDAVTVTEALLGQTLCRRLPDGRMVRYVLTELEAYVGPEDLACHASKGKTARTAVMFEPGGVCYVYLCYGIHWMLNFVTGGREHPAAILVRGISGIHGPGRVTKALAVDRALNAEALLPENGLWVEHSGVVASAQAYDRLPRVGIDYAGEQWRDAPLRYVLKGG